MFEENESYEAYFKGMDQYIEAFIKLQKENPEKAREKAKISLIHSGILDKDGNQKVHICQ